MRSGTHWTSTEDTALRFAWPTRTAEILAALFPTRTSGAIYSRARLLRLRSGPPPGHAHLQNVARTLGIDSRLLLKIAAWAGVEVRRVPTESPVLHQYARSVNVADAREALKRWDSQTETVGSAARRTSVDGTNLHRWLIAAGVLPVETHPRKHPQRRVASVEIDRAITLHCRRSRVTADAT